MATTRRFPLLLLALLSAALPSPARSQTSEPCDAYTACALNIVPRWNGLAVVRGTSEAHVATLGFLVPGSLRSAFDGDSLATAIGAQAVRTRRLAAALTDMGALAILVGAIRADQDGIDAGRGLLIGGAVAFSVSVPLQFRADGQLARAVWTYNRRFAAP